MPDRIRLHCIGVRFRDADAGAVEALVLDRSQVADAHAALDDHLRGAEAVVVATCNRTELYVAEAGDDEALDLWHRTIGHSPDGGCPAAAAHRYHHRGEAAIAHLLEVAAGLDSDELGDVDILGQLRRARTVAEDAGHVGPVLHRVLDGAARAGRRVRAETALGAGGASIGAAVSSVVADLGDRGPVLVVGAGHAGASTCRALVRAGHDVAVHSRSPERARAVAADTGAAPVDDLTLALARAGVVVSAVEAGRVAVADDTVAGRPGPTVGIDLSPIPSITADGIRVVPLRDVQRRGDAILATRRSAVPAARSIVHTEVASLAQWFRTRALDDMVAALFAEADDLIATEAAGAAEDVRQAIRRRIRSETHRRVRRLRASI